MTTDYSLIIGKLKTVQEKEIKIPPELLEEEKQAEEGQSKTETETKEEAE